MHTSLVEEAAKADAEIAEILEPSPAPGMSLALYGALCRRLEANWRVLRHCRIAVGGEEYVVQLVIMHRDFGVGLIAFRAGHYAFPDMAVRLTRDLLREHGFPQRFDGFLPVVFIAADPKDAPDMPARIARAFAAERALDIPDPRWVDCVASILRPTASEERGPAAEPDDAAEHAAPHAAMDDEYVAPRRRWRLAALLGAPLLLFGASIGALASGLIVGGGWHDGKSGSSYAAAPILPAAAAVSGTADCNARLFTEERVARYLGLDLAAFHDRRAKLKGAGFPEPEPITGGYDKAAIDRWLDQRAGRS